MGDIRGVMRNALVSAFSLGRPGEKKPEDKQEKANDLLGAIKQELADANDKLINLPAKLAEAIKNAGSQAINSYAQAAGQAKDLGTIGGIQITNPFAAAAERAAKGAAAILEGKGINEW